MKITLKPRMARLLISRRESGRREEASGRLEEAIRQGRWAEVPPIWITPNLILNGLLCGLKSGEWHPTLKPFIVYNGHHRRHMAIEHQLPISAYVRFTPGNPKMPEEERLQYEIAH